MTPSTTKQWKLRGNEGFESLKFEAEAPLPPLKEREVLVHLKAASLNYRDLIISKGKYILPVKDDTVPGSDGAGIVEATGPGVTRFKKGDKVVTLFNQAHLAGSPTPSILATGLGANLDGTFRQYGAFDEGGLVAMPETLSFEEAATLTCAGLTAWNALYGLTSLALKSGDTVLTQGTGGVSIFALQFAKAAGARVIATTSSEEKSDVLYKLGADHVINYRTDPNWGESAKKLTPGGLGANHVIEVGGPNTMNQSLNAIKMGGVISVIGFLGGGKGEEQPSFLQALLRDCIVRGLLVGDRLQFEEMNQAVDAAKIKPVVDEKVFKLEELKEAFQYMWDQKHFGKLVITID